MKEYQREDGVMYLYDADSEKVLVYQLIPKEKEFFEYKKAQIETIPEDKRRMQALTSKTKILEAAYMPERGFSRRKKFKASELSFYQEFGRNHEIIPLSAWTEQELIESGLDDGKLIEEYCHKLGVSNYLEIEEDKIIGPKALILGTDYYHGVDVFNSTLRKSDIINIPISLLRLEQFMDGCFEDIYEQQLEEILRLYESIDINNPVYTKDFADLKQMAQYFPRLAVLPTDIEQGIKNDEKVLSFLKKHR